MRVILLLAALGLVAGCQSEEPAPPETSGVEAASDTTEMEPLPITEPTDLVVSETAQPSLLESADLGVIGEDAGNSDGVGDISAGDELELVVRVTEVPEGLAAWVHWLGPDGDKVSEEQKDVPGNGTVTFRAETDGWAPGDYSAEIFIGGDLVDIKSFRLISE